MQAVRLRQSCIGLVRLCMGPYRHGTCVLTAQLWLIILCGYLGDATTRGVGEMCGVLTSVWHFNPLGLHMDKHIPIIETFQWSHPQMVGENPPHCRAHTATLVDRKLIVFGGGEGSVYYNQLYILDTS